jgi:hypothetical protein
VFHEWLHLRRDALGLARIRSGDDEDVRHVIITVAVANYEVPLDPHETLMQEKSAVPELPTFGRLFSPWARIAACSLFRSSDRSRVKLFDPTPWLEKMETSFLRLVISAANSSPL